MVAIPHNGQRPSSRVIWCLRLFCFLHILVLCCLFAQCLCCRECTKKGPATHLFCWDTKSGVSAVRWCSEKWTPWWYRCEWAQSLAVLLPVIRNKVNFEARKGIVTYLRWCCVSSSTQKITLWLCFFIQLPGNGVNGCQSVPGHSDGVRPWANVLSTVPNALWYQASSLCRNYSQGKGPLV